MNVHCPRGLHYGVFQGLDPVECRHTFYVNAWDPHRAIPGNVKVMTAQQAAHPEDAFFGAVLVQSEADYLLVRGLSKPILFYHLVNARPPYNLRWIYRNPEVIPVFLMSSCKMSWEVFDGPHKTIYHGVDPAKWIGWTGSESTVLTVKNAFQARDPRRFGLYRGIAEGFQARLLGVGGDRECGEAELLGEYQRARLFLNVEIAGSPFDTACVEAMMTGMPMISTDMESSGEFIRNGIEGFISNNPAYLKKKIREVLADDSLARHLGANARKMAELRFGKAQFNRQWNDLLDDLDSYWRQGDWSFSFYGRIKRIYQALKWI
ncbi:MAG: glycosyltransferase [candidate division FCPU426 bacterium]